MLIILQQDNNNNLLLIILLHNIIKMKIKHKVYLYMDNQEQVNQ